MDRTIRTRVSVSVMIEYDDRTEFLTISRRNDSIETMSSLSRQIVTVGDVVILGYDIS